MKKTFEVLGTLNVFFILYICVNTTVTMAQEKLIVKNFGPIKEAELDLGKVTVFIGEQASGKSVLAKLVAIMNKYDFLLEKDLHKKLLDFKIKNYLKTNSEIYYTSNNYSVKYFEEKLEVIFTNLGLNKLINDYIETKYVSEQMYNDLESKSPVATGEDYDWFPIKLEELYLSIQKKIVTPVYIPTERILIPLLSKAFFGLSRNRNLITIPDFLLEFGNDFQYSSVYDLSAITITVLDLKYESNNNGDILTLNDGTKVNLLEASSGYQSTIPMYIVIENKSKNDNQLFIVEEPELNLYPTTQKRLVEYLAGKTDKNSLILTTHSPYILSSLDNLIQAGNVVKKYPELKEEVEKIIPAQYHLNYEDVKVYFVADGTARLIMNEEYQSIDVSELDEVSEDLNADFEKLLELKYQD